MTPTSLIKKNYNAMVDLLLELQRTLHQTPPARAYTASIEPVSPQDEWKLNTELNPDLIITPVSMHEGKAIKQACDTYLDLHVIPGLSQRLTRRTPGMLWVNSQQNPMANKIEQLCIDINQAKTNISNCVTETHSKAKERFDLLKDALPATFTLHLYRHIRCFSGEQISHVHFNWIRQQAVLKANKAKLLENITSACQDSKNQNKLISLEALANAVANTPEYKLRMRRSQPVQPMANIRAVGATKYTPYPAAMPIVIIQPEMPALKLLQPYDNIQRLSARKPRSDRQTNVYLGHFYGHIIEATN